MKRTVIVTGGTKGLGREIALAFGRAGYRVVASFANDDASANELKGLFQDACIEGSIVRHDVTSVDDSFSKLAEIQEAESLILIHNACASFSPKPLHQLNWQDFEHSLGVAVKGAWTSSRAVIRLMLNKGGGAILNILSSAVEGPAPKGFAAYLTAKHALRGFTLALAAEYSPRGVRVFSASPGFMDTPLTAEWDVRMRDMLRSSSSRITVPAIAAGRLVEILESTSCPGQGEDYPI